MPLIVLQVRRALDIVVQAMQKLGHEVIDWSPPHSTSHKALVDIAMKTWLFDGGLDAHKGLALSGEPLIPQMQLMAQEMPQYNATQIMEVNIEKREQQKAYMEYWNSTATLTKDGSIVDCIISPIAPYPAARKLLYKYYGYSVWVNLLDYTSVVIPVTTASKEQDPADKDYTPMNDTDKDAFEACKYRMALNASIANSATDDAEIYDGSAVSIQLVGRRLQEEKMLAIADYVSKALQG